MKKYIILFTIYCLFNTLLLAQTAEPVLNQNILNSFMKNYDMIEKEIIKLKIDNNSVSPKVIKRSLAGKPYYNKSIENLKNYGLGENPLDSYLAIVYAYSYLVISDEIKMTKDDSLKVMYNQSINRYKSVLTMEDISLVEKNRKKLYTKF